MKKTFLKNPLVTDIVGMLAISNFPPAEKRIWTNLLPKMTAEEISELHDLLQKEIEYETKTVHEANEVFFKTLENKGL